MDVFAYGSLTALEGRPARLLGYRRVWGVAMDNRVAIPGYKAYEDPATGERPPVFVAFLDLAEDPEAEVEGVLLEVDHDELAALDARERNYEWTQVATQEGTTAWVYVGSQKGRARFAEGRRTGTLVVDAAYLAAVAGLAPPPPCPVRALRRVDL